MAKVEWGTMHTKKRKNTNKQRVTDKKGFFISIKKALSGLYSNLSVCVLWSVEIPGYFFCARHNQ